MRQLDAHRFQIFTRFYILTTDRANGIAYIMYINQREVSEMKTAKVYVLRDKTNGEYVNDFLGLSTSPKLEEAVVVKRKSCADFWVEGCKRLEIVPLTILGVEEL